MNVVWICWAGVLAIAASSAAFGAESAPGPRRSDNFIIHDSRLRVPGTPLRGASTNAAWVTFDLDGLTVSSDRIREAVIREMGFPTRHRSRSKVHLFLKRAVVENQEIEVISTYYTDGWQYRLWIPEKVERVKFVRALVYVLLLEFANREAGPKSAEIPLWFTEGLTEHLIASVGPDLIVDSIPTGMMLRTVQRVQGADPVKQTREFLAQRDVLSFSDLARPSPAHLSPENIELFQKSAHLFFFELRRFAKPSLVELLQTLPFCWNWETAFLHVFSPHFERLLDVEKWWSVSVAAFSGRDARQLWSREACLEKLDALLVASAHVRLATNTLPVRVEVTVQQAIADWEFPAQKQVIESILERLTYLRMSSPADMIGLLDEYRSCLRGYLDKRMEAISGSTTRLHVVPPTRLVVQETIRRLDELYREREILRRDLITANAISP